MRSMAASTTRDGQPGGAEEAEHPGAAHRLDDLGRADAVGHRPGHVGEAQPMVGAKRRIAQVFERVCRNENLMEVTVAIRRAGSVSDRSANHERLLDLLKCRRERGGIVGGDGADGLRRR